MPGNLLQRGFAVWIGANHLEAVGAVDELLEALGDAGLIFDDADADGLSRMDCHEVGCGLTTCLHN